MVLLQLITMGGMFAVAVLLWKEIRKDLGHLDQKMTKLLAKGTPDEGKPTRGEIQAEINTIRGILERLPVDQVIERTSLEARIQQLKEDFKEAL